MAIKRVRCVKFTDSYDNSSFLKPDNNTENPEYLITYEVEPEDNPNAEGEGQITCYPIRQRKPPDLYVVENFEFGGVDYCCILHMIPANYFEAVNSPDSNRWILAMRREFDPLIENNTFEWQKTPKNKNIIFCIAQLKSRWLPKFQ